MYLDTYYYWYIYDLSVDEKENTMNRRFKNRL